MRRMVLSLPIVSLWVCLITTTVLAQTNPNGFPSGEHFNLNIISKKTDYHCSLQVDEFGNPVYGNVIFVPEGEDVKIKMQSGKIKGKKLADMGDTLQVIDPCADFTHDTTRDAAAILQLPPNSAGYGVYARMVGTPIENGNMTIEPGIDYVADDDGNLLWFAGSVGKGFSCEDQTIDEHHKGSQGKDSTGQSVATDISCLFQWSGDVCYFNPDSSGQSYCDGCLTWDETVNPPVCTDYQSCEPGELCCKECCNLVENPTDLFDICCDDPGLCEDTGSCVSGPYIGGCQLPVIVDSVSTCTEGSLVDVWCRLYDTPVWVFNIADFVQYFWDATSNGKVVQVRFYKN